MKKITFLNAIFFMAALSISNLKAQTLAAHYTFNGNFNSSGGTYTEALSPSSAASYSFVEDQNMVSNNAIEAIGQEWDYLETPTDFSFFGVQSRTYTIWFKVPSPGATYSYGLIDMGTHNIQRDGSRMSLSVLDDNNFHIGFKGAGYRIGVVPFDTWIFGAVVLDGQNVKGYMTTGADVTELINENVPFEVNTILSSLVIGNSVVGNLNSRGAIGSIADVRVYEGVLTEAQLNLVKNGASLGSEDVQFSKNELKLTSTVVDDKIDIESNISGAVQITIHDLSGKAVKTEFSKSVNVSGLASGLYIVNVRIGNKVGSLKFIKK
ncbi:putative secreted protein (Por secretion system target) [Jejuia pallidilutea]|uniref:Putative secreted protein (Por secretion system target) n=1 Tax=Jejuia pallidilutea TaxID=504487 RepID=A0A362X4Y6_9FLAO|nr:T9SS type A sorting domain-containing protein [Jejuia pallidilutea]PQV51509.1 putative secreted protein (Por secretion system target) [Jejuia pallidilutea]